MDKFGELGIVRSGVYGVHCYQRGTRLMNPSADLFSDTLKEKNRDKRKEEEQKRQEPRRSGRAGYTWCPQQGVPTFHVTSPTSLGR